MDSLNTSISNMAPHLTVFKHFFLTALVAWLSIFSTASATGLQLQDDAGRWVRLPEPATRVISLAPHITELVFAAGGGSRLVGVTRHSDFPAAARQLPLVGDSHALDYERILALKPNLLLVWSHGNGQRQLQALEKLGIPLFYSDPQRLHQLPAALSKLGQLLGTAPAAQAAAQQLQQQLQQLERQYAARPAVRVFYQVWPQPLYTLNEQTMIHDVIRGCGGINVFAHLPIRAPTVSIEAVLAANPEVMLTGAGMGTGLNAFERWRQFPQLTATARQNFFAIPADWLHRPTPRLVAGMQAVCQALEQARQRRPSVE